MKKPAEKSMKKIISLALCLATAFLVGAPALEAGAVSLVSNYTRELWLAEGCSDMLCRGEKQPIDEENPAATPFIYQGTTATAYVPFQAVSIYYALTARKAAYFSLDGDGLGCTLHVSSNTYHLTFGSTAVDGLSSELLLPPLYQNDTLYMSLMTVRTFFGFNVYQHEGLGLIVISNQTINYNKSYDSMVNQVYTMGQKLIHQMISDTQIYDDVEAHIGVETHPRLIITQDKFDELRKRFDAGTDACTDANDLLYTKRVMTFEKDAQNFLKQYFTTDAETGKLIWKTKEDGTSAALDFRQPYYLYDEHGKRLVGAKTYTYTDGNDVYTYYLKQGTDTVTEKDGKTYHTIYEKPVNGWYSTGNGDGYRSDGRSEPSNWTTKLQSFGYGWQMTHNPQYAEAFYLIAKALGEWEHWGDGHFLNCADSATLFAYGYDWIYHAFDSEPEKQYEMAKILYDKCVYMGYLSCMYGQRGTTYSRYAGMHYSSLQGAGVSIWHRDNNWNSVCSAGVILSSMIAMQYEDLRPISCEVTATLMNQLDYYLFEYAPDGAFAESPTYWGYATQTLMRLLGATTCSAGTDYGYLSSPGLRESYYYCAYMCDSDFYAWNFHDAGRSILTDALYYLAAKLYNDPGLAKIRDTMLFERRVISSNLVDVLTYEPGFSATGDDLDLDYYAESLGTVTMRSSWDHNSIFVGLQADENDFVHGDADSGNFYMVKDGVVWFGDPGTEDYGVKNYFSRSLTANPNRYMYYRKSTEGHNTVVIDNMRYGQIINTRNQEHAHITKYETNEHGAIAVADMTPQYGETCTSGTRALMLTNDRSTVVLQDEISFTSGTYLTWIAAYNGKALIESDGRTAYIYNGTRRLRVTLLSDDESLRFSITPAGQTILSTTITSAQGASGYAKPSDPPARLTIRAQNVREFKVAVVFEEITDDDQIVGYKKTDIADMAISDGAWIAEEMARIKEEQSKVYPYSQAELIRVLRNLEATGSFVEQFELLRDSVGMFAEGAFNPKEKAPQERLPELQSYVNAYNSAVRKANSQFEKMFGVAMAE